MAEPRAATPIEESSAAALAALIAELPDQLRRQALTHSSWADRRIHSWGRLAFLGDSVLGLVIAEELYRRYPRSDIGRLTKVHGQTVSGRACAAVARSLEVRAMLEEVGPGERENGIEIGELESSERAMASVTEALIGACFLHAGLERSAAAVLEAFEPEIELASGTLLDFKSALQERLARRGRTVSYALTSQSGPPHDRRFEVEARVDGEVIGSGSGPTKKAAEQAAAAEALGGERG